MIALHVGACAVRTLTDEEFARCETFNTRDEAFARAKQLGLRAGEWTTWNLDKMTARRAKQEKFGAVDESLEPRIAELVAERNCSRGWAVSLAKREARGEKVGRPAKVNAASAMGAPSGIAS